MQQTCQSSVFKILHNMLRPNIRKNKAELPLAIMILHSKERLVLTFCINVDGRCRIEIVTVLKDDRFL